MAEFPIFFFTPDGKKILTSHESSYMERNGKTDVPIPLNEGSALILCDAETGKGIKTVSFHQSWNLPVWAMGG